MLRPPYRGRFAPTPSGDLHLGGARTALIAWLDARTQGGQFVLRIEDLDEQRTVIPAEARILSDLTWLGLSWDEGPDRGGDYAPYRQSEKRARFGEVLAQLLVEEKAYPCFCSRKEIALASVAPHEGDDGPRYPGTCAHLTRRQIADRAKTRAPAIRLRVPMRSVHFTDRVHGVCSDDVSASTGDFVLRRTDCIPAYQLAVVVDDAEMHITDVVRADDLLTSTARQILLYEALGLTPPRFAHVPLLLGPDGMRLAKRHGAVSISSLRQRGISPEQTLGALGATLGLCAPGEKRSPSDLLVGFDISRMRQRASQVDPSQFCA